MSCISLYELRSAYTFLTGFFSLPDMQLMLDTWNESIFSNIKNRLQDSAMKLVHAERLGEAFDSQLVIGVRESYGMSCTDWSLLPPYWSKWIFIVEADSCGSRVGMIISAFCLDFVTTDMWYQLNYVQSILTSKWFCYVSFSVRSVFLRSKLLDVSRLQKYPYACAPLLTVCDSSGSLKKHEAGCIADCHSSSFFAKQNLCATSPLPAFSSKPCSLLFWLSEVNLSLFEAKIGQLVTLNSGCLCGIHIVHCNL